MCGGRSATICLVFITLAKLAWKPCVQQSFEGDDSDCLNGLRRSLRSDALSSWNEGSLQSPCSSSTVTTLAGITCNNNRVYAIALNASRLVGTLPSNLANCSLLESLDISDNQISGPIPSNIGNLTYLTVLNFSNNLLSDNIPTELSQCLYLNVIDLHQNKLTGSIPGQLGLLQRLKVFDVSNNELSGAIPVTLSNTSTGAPRFNASSFIGNPYLYGYPLLPGGGSHSLSVLAIVVIGLASGLISLVVSFSSVCLWLRATEQGSSAEEAKISHLEAQS